MKAVSRKFLDLWHEAVLHEKVEVLKSIIDESVEFHTPVYMKPRKGHKIVVAVLMSARSHFGDFKYEREWVSEDGKDFTLEFYAKVEGKIVKGVDLIRINDEGKIVHMEVMIRPIKQLGRFAELQAETIPKFYAQLWPGSKL
ncbi:hypothetical protein HDU67_002477 [Dinochytrium kinnereticum]|nr:hypothetical protein HDU67_002477 [Dinochytrium kinnereticum]